MIRLSLSPALLGLAVLALVLSAGPATCPEPGFAERHHCRRAAHRAADAHQSRLRVVHPGRRQSQRLGRRLVPQSRATPRGATRCRCCACRASGSTRESRSRRRRAEHVRGQHPRSRAGRPLRRSAGDDRPGRDRRRLRLQGDRGPCARAPNRCRIAAAGPSRLPARLQGNEDRAGVRRVDVRLQRLVRRHRLGDVRAPRVKAGRHHPRSRRHVYKYYRYESTPTTRPSIAPCRSTAPIT